MTDQIETEPQFTEEHTYSIKNVFLLTRDRFGSDTNKSSPTDISVSAKLVDENNKGAFVIFNKEIIEISDNESAIYGSSKIKVNGIRINISTSAYQTNQIPDNFNLIRGIVESAFRLLALAFHENFSEISPENQPYVDDENFHQLRTYLLKLAVGGKIEFVYFYHPKVTHQETMEISKDLFSIFDSPEKTTFIKNTSAKVDQNADIDDFILIFDKSALNNVLLKKVKDELINNISISSFSDYILNKKNSAEPTQ